MASQVGTRSLRVEYLQPSHKEAIPDLLRLVTSYVQDNFSEVPARPAHREHFPRFYQAFFSHNGNELLPPIVFIEALQMGVSESINGVEHQFSTQVQAARDEFILAYKPMLPKLRQLISNEIKTIPQNMLLTFMYSWFHWEGLWLQEREYHAVEALQPLAKAILSLQPFLESRRKEKLHPYPRVQAQRQISYRCLIGFVQSLGILSAQVLSSLNRELSPDPRLFLLLDYILSQADKNPDGFSCVKGMAETPDIYFVEGGSNIKLPAYAFRLLNQKTVVARGIEFLGSFERVKNVLLKLQDDDLLKINPALDQTFELTSALNEFEKNFRKCKKLYLEPDNLI